MQKNRLLVWGFFVFLILAWQAIVTGFGIMPLLFPGPRDVAVALYQGIASGDMLTHVGVTFYEVMAGFLAGALCGLVLGALIGQIRFLETLLYPYVVAFQTLPKVALAPLFVVWFGFGTTSKVIITATIVFFPVMVNTIAGLRSAPRDQTDLMLAFTANRWQIFRMAKLPHALPYVFAGLDIGIVLAVIGALVGEFVGAQAGLGYLIMQRNASLDIPGVFAILVLLCLMGLALHAAMKLISKKVVFWAEANHDISGA